MTNNDFWWSRKWGKEHTCPISYSRLRQGKNSHGYRNTTTLKCKHRFCTTSLLSMINMRKDKYVFNCPVCRVPFTVSDIK